MRFSKRTDWNTEESDLARAHRRRVEAGLPIADLTASNPTRCGFEYPHDLLGVLTRSEALDYDPQPRGLLAAREAVCAYYKDHGVAVNPAQIVMTTSTSEAYSYLLRLVCDPGAEILVPLPGYPLFDYLAVLDDVRIRPVPLVYDHGWQIDPEGFRRAISPQTRAIMLVHPNNPTGHFTKAWEAEELARLCREFELSLIVDEVFLDYAHDGASRTSFVTNADSLTFTLSGVSKISALPQMKLAWVATSGPKEMVTEAGARLEVIADTYLSMNAPVQLAAAVLLDQRKQIQPILLDRLRVNLAELDRQLGGHPSCARLQVEGGWYVVLRVPVLGTDEDLAIDLLRKMSVIVHPGHFYDFPSDGHLVLSLITEPANFREGVSRLLQVVEG